MIGTWLRLPSKKPKLLLWRRSATYRPWNRTKLTISLERGSWDRLHVQNSVVSDAHTPWLLAGKPMVSGKAGTFNTAIGSGLQTLTTATYLVYVEGSNAPIQDWRNTARGAQWSNSVPTGNPGSGLMLTADRALMSNIGFNEGNAIVDLDANWWGKTNTNDLNYQVESVFLEQNLARDLDLELAWNRHTSDYIFNSFGMNNSIFVDPNLCVTKGVPVRRVPSGIQAPKTAGRDARHHFSHHLCSSYVMSILARKAFFLAAPWKRMLCVSWS